MVASVAATSNGVARAVKLGAYRVIGCEDDFTSDDVILQAIDRAVSEGCNIINLSLGSTSGYTEYVSLCRCACMFAAATRACTQTPLLATLLAARVQSLYASVMRNAFNRGVLVVRAAGNSGEDGPFTADGTLASGGISVAAAGYSETTVDTELLMSGYSSFGPVRRHAGAGGSLLLQQALQSSAVMFLSTAPACLACHAAGAQPRPAAACCGAGHQHPRPHARRLGDDRVWDLAGVAVCCRRAGAVAAAKARDSGGGRQYVAGVERQPGRGNSRAGHNGAAHP